MNTINKILSDFKATFFMIVLLFCLPILSNSQTVTASYSGSPSAGDTIIVPVVFNYTGNTFAFDFYMTYNAEVLTFIGYDSLAVVLGSNPGAWAISSTEINNPDYKINIGWGSNNSPWYNVFTSVRLARLKLIYHGGTTSFSFNTSTNYCYVEDLDNGILDPNNFYTGFTITGSKVPITSKVAGGLWRSASTWSPANVPNASANTEVYIGSTTNPVVIDSNLTVTNNVTVNSGAKLTVNSGTTLTTSGSFTIKDGGSFVNNGGSNQTAIVERTLGNDNSWHLLSSPVAGQSITSGFAPVSMNETFDFYKWDESVDKYTGAPWVNLRATPSTFTPGFESSFQGGRGYLVAYDGSWSASHSFSGTLGNGDKTIAVSYSNNHCNLIGNPYPSAIDWNASGYTRSCLADLGIYIWNPSVGQYGVYLSPAEGTNGVSNIIAPNQGFFVTTASAGSVIIPNTARVHGSQSFLKSTPSDLLRLKVISTANSYSDEIIVNFNNNATINQGMAKWFTFVSEAPSLYSVKNNNNLSINTLPAITNDLTVAVGFKAGVNGTYIIKASELNSFTTTTYIYLKDLKTNSLTDLNLHPMHLFAATTTDNVNRFQLIFSTTALAISEQVNEVTGIYSYDNTITINSNENMKEIAIYNTMGQLIKTIGTSNGTVKVDMNGNPMGYYIVKVITDKNVYSEKVLVK